jgi:arsenate reductase
MSIQGCCHRRLRDGAVVTDYVGLLVERFARDRLKALAQANDVSETPVPEVLFVCVHNAGRSQMGAALLTRLAAGGVRAGSAGTQPAHEIDPAVKEALEEWGIDISQEVPKPLTDEALQSADIIVGMGCGDACRVAPGKRYLEWPLDDPSGKSLEEVRRIRDEIRSRVEELLDELLAPVG